MQNTLTPDAALAICEHMNDDHADSIVDYARTFAKLPDATAARMLSIDAAGMDLEATVGGENVAARVAFDHPLVDAVDARTTLIAMAKTASAP